MPPFNFCGMPILLGLSLMGKALCNVEEAFAVLESKPNVQFGFAQRALSSMHYALYVRVS